jgi:hypothetical protein
MGDPAFAAILAPDHISATPLRRRDALQCLG